MDKTKKLINNLKPQVQKLTPIATDMFIPNHSGKLDAGRVYAAPTTDYQPANKKYVDDSIAAIPGGGDVVGPAGAVGSNFAGFDGVTGKIIKDSGSKATDFATSAHTHVLTAGATDVTSTKDELNKLDGADANVTAAKLNTLSALQDTEIALIDGASIIGAIVAGKAVVYGGVLANSYISSYFQRLYSGSFYYYLTPSAIAANRTLTLPLLTSDDYIVCRDFTETLTNKTLTSPTLTNPVCVEPWIKETGGGTDYYKILAGNLAATRNCILPVLTADDTFVFRNHTETLTNKTLTSPVLNTGISGTAFLDEDDMASNSATKVASQQSIKAYIDGKVVTDPMTACWKTADQSWTNDAVVDDVTDMSFTVAANKKYSFQFYIFADTHATPDMRIAVTCPAASTIAYDCTDNARSEFVSASGTDIETASTTGDYVVLVSGFCQTGANSGTIQLQAAQRASGGTTITIRARSYGYCYNHG